MVTPTAPVTAPVHHSPLEDTRSSLNRTARLDRMNRTQNCVTRGARRFESQQMKLRNTQVKMLVPCDEQGISESHE